jgi:hypothetical protein
MSAIGLAIMSNMRNNPRLLVDARADYARALEVTNTALRSKSQCLEETTLNAVMLLGMFEVPTSYFFDEETLTWEGDFV